VRGPRVGLIASLLILPITAADKAPPRLVGSPWAAVAGDTGAVVLIAAGGNRSCAVTTAGAAYCWGGEGGSPLRRFAAQVSWHIIALAPNRGCGIDTGGRTYCWGANADGQLGAPPDSVDHTAPVAIDGLPLLSALAVGVRHACGLAVSGRIYCWGSNRNGELGRGFRSPWERPAPVFSVLHYATVAAYANTSCALDIDGYPSCWGVDVNFVVGDPRDADCPDSVTTPSSTAMPRRAHECVAVPEGMQSRRGLAALAAQGWPGAEACGLTDAGAMYCWKAIRAPAQRATDWPPLKSITGGRSHWCGPSLQGAAYCWGDVSAGKLGSRDTLPGDRPRSVAGDLTFQMLAAGTDHTCGLTTDGRIYCWGWNNAGQLGADTPSRGAVPVEVKLSPS